MVLVRVGVSRALLVGLLGGGLGVLASCGGGDGAQAGDGGPPGGPGGAGGASAGTRPGADGGVPGLFDHPLCRAAYPARACDGDPQGKWTLAALCVNRFEGCRGAMVTVTGSTKATIDFQEGAPEASFIYEYDLDTERRLSVPRACLGGASCESIGCFAGDDPCACVLGSSRGGTVSATWTPVVTGEVVTGYGDGRQMVPLRFCAGANTADSTIGGSRLIWTRVCEEGRDCRPSNPCRLGRARCAAGGLTCEDAGADRRRGATCGVDRVCDGMGACVACAAGAACQVPDQPCKKGKISCGTAAPVCVPDGNLPDGTACGDRRACLAGVCKAEDGVACTSDGECRERCTCGDARCTQRFCGRVCPCQYAPPGGACAGVLEDGARDPSSCQKACFKGRCLTEVGQRCGADAECGSGHCTCWLPNCSGGRLCSRVACPCQWARSGEDTCGGPLMDGLMDFSCRAPQSCVGGKCQ